MNQKSNDVQLRSDRVLIGALAVVLCAASAALGAVAVYHPHTEEARTSATATASSSVQSSPSAELNASYHPAEPQKDVSAEKLIMARLLAEHRCLSEALYYEARGEGVEGEKAVAEVIFHRMRTGNYGDSICAVVYEGAGHTGCQFSFTCNGDLKQPKVARSWMRAQQLAAKILTGEERLKDVTEGAISYHAVSVSPDWANYLQRTVQIGNHIFYKYPARSRTM